MDPCFGRADRPEEERHVAQHPAIMAFQRIGREYNRAATSRKSIPFSCYALGDYCRFRGKLKMFHERTG